MGALCGDDRGGNRLRVTRTLMPRSGAPGTRTSLPRCLALAMTNDCDAMTITDSPPYRHLCSALRGVLRLPAVSIAAPVLATPPPTTGESNPARNGLLIPAERRRENTMQIAALPRDRPH